MTPFARILAAFPVDRPFWAELIGCSQRQLADWQTGRRPVPGSVADVLAEALGVPRDVLTARASDVQPERVLPPLWLKARESRLGEAEHRAIAAARLLAARYEELLAITEPSRSDPRFMMAEVRQRVDPQQPARVQGAVGAEAFLTLSGLGKGTTGVGEVIRGFLRARGVLILETPINNRRLEGFCVPVGGEVGPRPCLVANSYRTTWFRRNYVLLHELAHAVFDLDAASAVFDVGTAGDHDALDIAEQRADSFALNALVPRRLLVAIENRGHRLATLEPQDLAIVIAAVHAEQGLLARAAHEHGLIDSEAAMRLATLDVARELRACSYHARGLRDTPANQLIYPELLAWGERLTTFPVRGLRLPIPFVRLVIDAVGQGKITPAKAAELLMVDEGGLLRYGIEHRETEEAFAS